MLPANKLNNLKRRVARARRFPDNTCSASRHVEMMAYELERYGAISGEQQHCAESMLSVLESLWKARTKIAKLEGDRG